MVLTRTLATWFGSGLSPIAPGTAGTLATVPVYLAIVFLHLPALLTLAVAVVVAAVGIVVAGRYARQTGRQDPQEIVIDEAAGYLLACSLAPLSWRTAVLAFVLFRVLDACKPSVVRRFERLPGGWGIVADDLCAGAAAGIVTWLSWGLLAQRWAGPLSAP